MDFRDWEPAVAAGLNFDSDMEPVASDLQSAPTDFPSLLLVAAETVKGSCRLWSAAGYESQVTHRQIGPRSCEDCVLISG